MGIKQKVKYLLFLSGLVLLLLPADLSATAAIVAAIRKDKVIVRYLSGSGGSKEKITPAAVVAKLHLLADLTEALLREGKLGVEVRISLNDYMVVPDSSAFILSTEDCPYCD